MTLQEFEALVPGARRSILYTIEDVYFSQDLCGKDLKNKRFLRAIATKKTFTCVDFSYCFFDWCYFRDCIFKECKFVGARFIASNFRGAVFENCDFSYSTFEKTVEAGAIVDQVYSSFANVRVDVLRSLRVNFQQVGDVEGVNRTVLEEARASMDFLYAAWASGEEYYRKKYPGIRRFAKFFEWLGMKAMSVFWGHGEKPARLLVWLFLLIGLASFLEYRAAPDTNWLDAVRQGVSTTLGVSRSSQIGDIGLALLSTLRYVLIAFFITVLMRRLSRR